MKLRDNPSGCFFSQSQMTSSITFHLDTLSIIFWIMVSITRESYRVQSSLLWKSIDFYPNPCPSSVDALPYNSSVSKVFPLFPE